MALACVTIRSLDVPSLRCWLWKLCCITEPSCCEASGRVCGHVGWAWDTGLEGAFPSWSNVFFKYKSRNLCTFHLDLQEQIPKIWCTFHLQILKDVALSLCHHWRCVILRMLAVKNLLHCMPAMFWVLGSYSIVLPRTIIGKMAVPLGWNPYRIVGYI